MNVAHNWRFSPTEAASNTRTIGACRMPVAHSHRAAVHGDFKEATVWPGEPVRVGLAGEEPCWPVRRISPAGLEVVVPQGAGPVADDCALEICAGASRWLVTGARMVHLDSEESLGFRIPDRELGTVVAASAEYPILGRLRNPWRHRERAALRVVALTPDGVLATLKSERLALAPGQVVELELLVPPASSLRCCATVHSAGGAGNVFLSFVEPTIEHRQAIGQYVLEFGDVDGEPATPSVVVEQGFWVRSLAEACEYSLAELAGDYEDVLRLRARTYGENGKLDFRGDLAEMGDLHDTVARILTLRHRGRLVASLRLIYPDAETRLEHDALTQVPEQFRNIPDVLEGTRICTDPDYRKGDLLIELLRFNSVHSVESRRRWLLGCATADLAKTYERSGCVVTGTSFTHSVLGNTPHSLLYWDVQNTALARSMSWKVFLAVWRDTSQFLIDRGTVRPGRIDRARLALLDLLHPVVRRQVDSASRTPRGRRA